MSPSSNADRASAKDRTTVAPRVAGRGFRFLVTATAIATYALIIVGAVVRVTGSGLGCPDWPLCHGSILPPPDLPTWIEWSHRLTASLVTWLTLGTVAFTLWRYRGDRWIFRPVLLAVALLVLQIILGGITVLMELPPTIVAVHLANALALFASLVVAATSAVIGSGALRQRPLSSPVRRHLRLVALTALAVFALILTGSYVVGTGASYGCVDWPLCAGQFVPPAGSGLAQIHMFHRYVAAAVGLLVGWTVFQTWRRRRQFPAVARWALVLAVLFVVQILVGAVQIWTQLPWFLRGLHLALAAAIWGTLVVMTLLLYRLPEMGTAEAIPAHSPRTGEPRPGMALNPLDMRAEFRRLEANKSLAENRRDIGTIGALPARPETIGWTTQVTTGSSLAASPPMSFGEVTRAYFQLTKPPIVALLLVTTLAAMLIASNGLLKLGTLWWTMLGGALAAGGAGAVNSYLDRDIDSQMNRTRRRPLAAHQIDPRQALIFGLMLGALAILILTVFVNPLSALLAAIGYGYYTIVYTHYLKRSTPSNIIIGGAAGAIPPLVGWAAVTNGIDLMAIYLFAIIFYWTPPHTWALMLMVESDYQRVGVPMMPVARGEEETRWQIVLYTLVLIAITLMLYVTGTVGTLYLLSAVILGALFVWMSVSLLRIGTKAAARRLYKYSTLYLALLFLALVVDHGLRL